MALGAFTATAYGPPWGGMQGSGTSATGLKLLPGDYVIAVDPRVIPLGTRVHAWPNPFGDRSIVFTAADTGSAIKGRIIDFFDWRGRASQNRWGRRKVTLTPAAATAGMSANPYGSLVGSGLSFAGVDQGIDFTGAGDIYALDSGVVTRAQRSGSGWAGQGALLVEKLITGPDKGRFVYYAEDFNPLVQVGQTIGRGEVIGRATGSGRAPGIEVGFAQDASGRAYGTAFPRRPQPQGYAFQRFVEGMGPRDTTVGSAGSAAGAAAHAVAAPFEGLLSGVESLVLRGLMILAGAALVVLGVFLLAKALGSGKAAGVATSVMAVVPAGRATKAAGTASVSAERAAAREQRAQESHARRQEAHVASLEAKRRTKQEQEKAEHAAYFRGATDAAHERERIPKRRVRK